jgi:hypothetical protein
MRARVFLTALPLCAGLVACGPPEREWMKINESYTKEEFRRDLTACTRGTTLDEACMKSRGWVSVSAPKQVKPPEQQPVPTTPRYGR